MELVKHRRYSDRYVLAISSDGDLSQTALNIDTDPESDTFGCALFTWGIDPPENMSSSSYEKQQQRESSRLVQLELDRLGGGKKVSGEGRSLVLE